MDSKEVSREDMVRFAENGVGNYIRLNREARNYSQRDICDGICSASKFSRVELGERAVDYQTIEAFLGRMKMDRASYEFVLDAEDAVGYKHRQKIENLITKKKYEQAEEELKIYAEKYGTKEIQGQFYLFQSARLEREKEKPDKEKMKKLFQDALTVTAKDYQCKLDEREILSNLELECITEITHCIENSAEREEEQQKLYQYFQWSKEREGFFAFAFRAAMLYYAETLYENGKFDLCIQICDEVLEVYYSTSKLGDRGKVFFFRAKARKARGREEDRELYIRDLRIAYNVFSFYDGEEGIMKKKIEEEGEEIWPFTR
jgi:transcriptional regulator with XRE-family HTH domain